MKQSTFVAIFICTNLALVVAHIHKQSRSIKLSYLKQKIEIEKNNLLKQKQELSHQLHTLHDRISVKKFVSEKLPHLKPVKISQIKRLKDDSNV